MRKPPVFYCPDCEYHIGLQAAVAAACDSELNAAKTIPKRCSYCTDEYQAAKTGGDR